MKTIREIAWVAGLIEGEGSFMLKRGNSIIAVQMTDRDVLERLAAILGGKVGTYIRKPKGKATYKPVFHLAVHGTRAIGWMMTLYPLMGERRQEKIREILQFWKAMKSAPRSSRGERLPAICHPDRPRSANMLCNSCWMREWRKRNPEKGGIYNRNRRMKAEAVA